MSEAWDDVKGDLGDALREKGCKGLGGEGRDESEKARLVRVSDSLLSGVCVWVGLNLLVDPVLAFVLFSLHVEWWIICVALVTHIAVVVAVGLKRIHKFREDFAAEMAQRG